MEGIAFRAVVRGMAKAELRGLDLDACLALDLAVASESDLSAALDGVRSVIHVAGLVRGTKADLDTVNGSATRRLAAAFAAQCPGGRFVLMSSLAAAGPSSDGKGSSCAPEEAQPVSHYGRSKLEGERAVRELCASWITLRPGIVYGPWDSDVYVLFRMAARGVVPLTMAKSRYSLVHVDDLARAVVLALRADTAACGRAYPVVNAEALSQRDFLQRIARAVGREARLLPVPRVLAYFSAALGEAQAKFRGRPALFGFDKFREMRQGSWVGDPEPLRRAVGFEAAIDHDRGLASTASWYRDRALLPFVQA